MHPKQQITLPFVKYITQVLTLFDHRDVDSDLALIISEIDKDKSFCHVEFPDSHNTLSSPRLWDIKAWRVSQEKHERAKKLAEQTRLEIDNYRSNVHMLAEYLMSITGSSLDDSMELAQQKLRNSPADTYHAIGLKLITPYYKGSYVILPCRQEERYYHD